MKDIKKILYGPQNQFQKFKIRCYVKNYQAVDKSIRKRHPVLFRDKQTHFYTFDPTEELLKTLPLKFLNELDESSFSLLPEPLLDKIQKTIKQAENTLDIQHPTINC